MRAQIGWIWRTAWSLLVYQEESDGGFGMSDGQVTLRLNQQQLELLDRTVAKGEAPDRKSLIRRALREYGARHVQPLKEKADG